MSKWSSAASSLVCLGLLALAACGPRGGDKEEQDGVRPGLGAVITRADTSVDEVASAEPGKDRHQWLAADNATRNKTGNLTASVEGRGGPLMLAFANGITEQAERDIKLPASESVAGGPKTFSAILSAEPEATVYLYRVTGEDIASVAKTGGLCGMDRTTFLAVAEYVGGDGEWVFHVAAFKGAGMPGPNGQSAPILCGAYHFAMP
ncbi:MAG TPA: hypothetical protein VG983_09305 [Caulobacterales bacterium]|jgi:hypothetical protein|nr:hypothetical protein [Caulobacterales bacterium]